MLLNEYLLLEGDLSRDGRFELYRAQTAPATLHWPSVPHSPVSLELLGTEGQVLHREGAALQEAVGCSPLSMTPWRVRAAIKIREDAVGVRLMREDLVLWSRGLPERPELAITDIELQLRKAREVVVHLRFSEPGDNAWMALVYQWGERKHRVLYLGEPKSAVTLDLRHMPGGPSCRVLATYSNGLRSAVAACEPFKVSLVGPSLTIVQPEPGSRQPYGVPLVLQAAVLDEERPGGASFDDLVWLVDGRELARGLMACTDILSEGRHEVTVEYRGPTAVRADIELSVCRLRDGPIASEWPEWDPVLGKTVGR
jgi:hypothetical protein